MITRHLLAALLGAALLTTATAARAVPGQLGLTARVADAGVPLTGNHTFAVRLYTGASGGSQVWTETITAPATDGLVYLTLGNTPATELDATVLDGGPLWVELQVDSTVLLPRLALTTAPYAIRAGVAEDAELLSGQPATAFAAVGHDHAGAYLPVGSTLACTGTQKVTAINPTTGSITCGADVDTSTPYTAGAGLLQSGTAFSVVFAGTGAAASAARSDHTHAGTYLPLGPALTCPAGQKVIALNPTTGSVTCALDVDTDTTYTAGSGLILSGSVFVASYYGIGGPYGVSPSLSRGDHGHGTTVCPTNYTAYSRIAGGVTTVICLRAIAAAAALNWNAATRACLTDSGAQLCRYEQIVQIRGITPSFGLTAAYWLGDRMGDNTAYVTNATGATDDFDSVGLVTDTKAGYYCCHERRWW